MMQVYKDIREQGHCEICGKADFGDGCSLKIDYVSWCDPSKFQRFINKVRR